MKLEDLTKQAEYKQHPFGQSWQPFDEATFKELVENVDRRGQDKEIILYQGMVLDGWHRYLACLATKTQPKFTSFTGTDLQAAEQVHASGIRRQTSADQRYASFKLLEKACPAFKEKYEQLKAQGDQQKKAGKPLDTGGQRVDVVQTKADAARVSKSTAKKVEQIEKENPAAVAEIAAGKTTANKELKKLKKGKENTKRSRKTGSDKSANANPAKGERPKIADLLGIIQRGLAATEEANRLAVKGNAVFFEVNGYRVKVMCKVV